MTIFFHFLQNRIQLPQSFPCSNFVCLFFLSFPLYFLSPILISCQNSLLHSPNKLQFLPWNVLCSGHFPIFSQFFTPFHTLAEIYRLWLLSLHFALLVALLFSFDLELFLLFNLLLFCYFLGCGEHP